MAPLMIPMDKNNGQIRDRETLLVIDDRWAPDVKLYPKKAIVR